MLFTRQNHAHCEHLRREIETACAAVSLTTIKNVGQFVARRFQQCIAACGGYFEHL
jgi:hypothetical protein